MTIGIVCAGPMAGLAAYRALVAVERVATGAIGGFAAFAAIDAQGLVHEASTQRGGSATLFIAGERTGGPPPQAIAAAPLAGLISSGPERPEPLSQFLAVDGSAGIVSGHRLPNSRGVDGTSYNVAVLNALRAGADAQSAVTRLLDANPQADVGLIAADRTGHIFAANSRRVEGRPDLGAARIDHHDPAASVAVLHNAIGPGPSVAALAAEMAMAIMVPRAPDAILHLLEGTPIEGGETARVEIDAEGRALRVITTDLELLRGRTNGAAVYLGAEVCREGQLLGHVADEAFCLIEDGRVVSMSGQNGFDIPYRSMARREG